MKLRYYTLLGINALLVLVWMVHLFAVQVLDVHKLSGTARLRYNPKNEILIPYRGNIYDRNGDLLVGSVKNFQVEVHRPTIELWCKKHDMQVSAYYDTLATLFAKNSDLTKSYVLNKLNGSGGASSVVLSNRIKESQLVLINNTIQEKGYPRLISSFHSMKRTYAQGDLAARMLGIVQEESLNSSNSIYTLKGVCGIEYALDNYLQGEPGWRKVMYDGNQREIPDREMKEKKARNGYNVELTIDSEFQEILEVNLSKAMDEYSAKNALGVIMDPNNGHILAMTGLSQFDKHKQTSAIRALANMPISFLFEPGSTMKPFTSLLAIEKNLYKGSDMIDCRKYRLERRTISDAHEFKMLSFKDVLAHSSNVGIAKVAEKVGEKSLYKRLTEVGFGLKTGLEVTGENPGIFRKLKDWNGFSLHSISFGQEIAVTAVQLASSYIPLANHGKVIQPTLVKRVYDENNETIFEHKTEVLRTISDQASLDTLRTYMAAVVEYGTGTAAQFPRVSIAGKTGTAEKMKAGGGYSDDKYTSVFAGYFPVENPQLLMVVVIDEPVYKYHYASMSAVPTFRDITENILALPTCRIMPDIRSDKHEMIEMPSVEGLSVTEAVRVLNQQHIAFEHLVRDPDGVVINQYPKAGVAFEKDNKVVIVIDHEAETAEKVSSSSTMPNLIGLTLRRAADLARRSNIKLTVKGNGVVSKQSIEAGEKINYGQVCKVVAR